MDIIPSIAFSLSYYKVFDFNYIYMFKLCVKYIQHLQLKG